MRTVADMERQPSRLRKPAQANEQSRWEESQSNGESQAEDGEKSGFSILFYPLVVCSLLVLVFLYQSKSKPFELPQPHPPSQLASPRVHDPDAFRPMIELHPEDHAHRDPIAQYFEWNVTSEYLRPDGVLKRVYLINGAFFYA